MQPRDTPAQTVPLARRHKDRRLPELGGGQSAARSARFAEDHNKPEPAVHPHHRRAVLRPARAAFLPVTPAAGPLLISARLGPGAGPRPVKQTTRVVSLGLCGTAWHVTLASCPLPLPLSWSQSSNSAVRRLGLTAASPPLVTKGPEAVFVPLLLLHHAICAGTAVLLAKHSPGQAAVA